MRTRMSYGDSIRTTAANLQKLFGEITCQDRAKTFCVFRSETKNKEKFSIYGLDKGKKIGSFDIEADSKEISAQVKKRDNRSITRERIMDKREA